MGSQFSNRAMSISKPSGMSQVVQWAVKDPNPSQFDSYDNGSGLSGFSLSQSATFASNTTNGNTLLGIAAMAMDGTYLVDSSADPVNAGWTQIGDLQNFTDCNVDIKAFVKRNASPLLTTSWVGTGAVSSGGVLTIGSGTGAFRLGQKIFSVHTPAATNTGGDVIVVSPISGTLGAPGSTYQLNPSIGSTTFTSEAMTTGDFVAVRRNANPGSDFPGVFLAEISGTDNSSAYFSGHNDAPTGAGTGTVVTGNLVMPASSGIVFGFSFNGGVNNGNPFPPLYAPTIDPVYTNSQDILIYSEGTPICRVGWQHFASCGTRQVGFNPSADSRYASVAVGFLDA